MIDLHGKSVVCENPEAVAGQAAGSLWGPVRARCPIGSRILAGLAQVHRLPAVSLERLDIGN